MDKQNKSDPEPLNPKESLKEIHQRIVENAIEGEKVRAEKEPDFQVRF